jgi:hypothetical protein
MPCRIIAATLAGLSMSSRMLRSTELGLLLRAGVDDWGGLRAARAAGRPATVRAAASRAVAGAPLGLPMSEATEVADQHFA